MFDRLYEGANGRCHQRHRCIERILVKGLLEFESIFIIILAFSEDLNDKCIYITIGDDHDRNTW